MRELKKKWIVLLVCLLAVLALSACGERQNAPEEEGDILVYAALNPVTKDLQRSIKNFNEEHPDVQIEIRDYSDEGGRDRLQIELLLGQVPDIMELRCYGKAGKDEWDPYAADSLPGSYTGPGGGYFMPYRHLAQKGYLEDLWPYIENDPELGRESVVEPILKAAEVNGGLYMLFQRVQIFTLIGRESVVGKRYSWTLDDVMDAYASMPEGSTIMRYNMTKREIFFNLLCNSLERFVDRETGECTFDSKGFRDLVGFLKEFPDEVAYEKPQKAEEEVRWRIWEGSQMLEGMSLYMPRCVGYSDGVLQEHAAFVGYPTADGSSGSFFYHTDTVLGMSSACKNKDAAWDYIRKLLTARIPDRTFPVFADIPVSRHNFEAICYYELYDSEMTSRRHPENPFPFAPRGRHFNDGTEVYLMELISEDHIQRFRDLVDHITQLYWPEDELSDIVWETLGPYFAGDRTLDDSIRIINNRVGLYLMEQK